MSRDDAKALLAQANQLKDEDPVKMQLCERAVSLADLSENKELQFDARLDLLEVAVFCGQPEKALVNFAWCIAQCEQHPNLFPLEMILWKYKWVIEGAVKFHTVTKAQLEQLVENMQAHYQRAGYSLRPVYFSRSQMYYHMGEIEKSLQALRQSKECGRDHFADCAACEADYNVRLLVAADMNEEALRAAEPILKGHLTCTEVPHLTYPELLLPCSLLQQLEKANHYLFKAFSLTRSNPTFLAQIGLQIQYCGVHGLVETGLPRFQQHLGWWLNSQAHRDRFYFELGATLLFRAAANQGMQKIALQLPRRFECFQQDNIYAAETLADYFYRQAHATAEAFDLRNKNPYYRHYMDKQLELQR